MSDSDVILRIFIEIRGSFYGTDCKLYVRLLYAMIQWADRSAVDRLLCKQDVASSNLAQSTTSTIQCLKVALSFVLSYDSMTVVGKEVQSPLEVLLLDEYVIRIERGYREHSDTVVRQYLGYVGQDTYQGEVQDSLDPERPPSVLPFDGVAWDTFCRAYE